MTEDWQQRHPIAIMGARPDRDQETPFDDPNVAKVIRILARAAQRIRERRQAG